MATFDLKPLTENIIQKLGLNHNELWEVKIGEEVFGPFETLSLKHYSAENKEIFAKALASPLGKDHWQDFFDITVFHKMEDIKIGSEYHGSFWFMIHGQKSEPVTKEDIEQLIDERRLNRHDGVSIDDGHTWTELCLCPIFSCHFVASTHLPQLPKTLNLSDRPFSHGEAPEEVEIAESLANKPHLDGKAPSSWPQSKIKVDEIPVPKLQDVQVSPGMKWAMPCAGAIVIALYFGFTHDFSTPGEENAIAAVDIENTNQTNKRTMRSRRERTPASVRPIEHNQRSALTQQPDITQDPYPAHVETHEYNQDMGSEIDREPADAIVEPPLEDAVATELPLENAEPQSLDAAMNAPQTAPADHDPALDQPVVEETSDF